MDIQTAITALLIILVVALPFYYHHLKHSKHEKKLEKILKEAAQKEGCNISRKQVFFQSAIGLDQKQGKLFFVHVNAEMPVTQFISLEGLQQCQLRTERGKHPESDMPGKAELVLQFTGKKTNSEVLVFFDKDAGPGSISDEVLGARKWADFLSISYTDKN